jgi:hypothetical protein
MPLNATHSVVVYTWNRRTPVYIFAVNTDMWSYLEVIIGRCEIRINYTQRLNVRHTSLYLIQNNAINNYFAYDILKP